MELEALLAEIRDGLKALDEREQKGEDVSGERQKLETRKRELEKVLGKGSGSNGGGGLTDDERAELERLRTFETQTTLVQAAEKAAEEIVSGYRERQTRAASAVAELVEKAVEQKLGLDGSGNGDALTESPILRAAVEQIVKGARAPSRYAGAGSSDDVLDTLAAGGGIAEPPRRTDEGRTRADVRVGENREVKQMLDSRNLTVMLGAIYRYRKGWAREADVYFLRTLDDKALAQGTDSAGGFLVPQEWMPDILTPLREMAVVRQAGPRVQGFSKRMNQTSISAGATAYYVAENAPITLSDLTFAEAALLTPKKLTGMVAVSNDLLEHSDDADDIVRNDLVEVIALREDLAFIQGSGGNEPTGMRNMSGVTLNPIAPGANGFQPTLADWRKIKAKTRRLRSPGSRWVAFFAPELVTRFETLTDSTGRFLADANILDYDENTGRGTLDSIPFWTSGQIPINLTLGTSTDVSYIILVNVADLVVGESRELRVDISTEAGYVIGATQHHAFQEDQTLFRAIMSHDIAHRRTSQVIVQEGARTTA